MTLVFRNSRIRLAPGQIFWREVGQEGRPIVFLHGGEHDSSQWLPLLEKLGQNNRGFAPDLLGFGDSEYPKVHHSIQLQVECLAAYLDALRLESVYLVGHSLGAWIAASYALQNRDRVAGLILISPLGVRENSDRKHWRTERSLLNPLTPLILKILAPFAKVIGKNRHLKALSQRRAELRQFPTFCQLLLRRRATEISAELLDNRLEFLQTPVLILQGAQEHPNQIAASQTYAKLATDAKFSLISQGDRDLPTQMPDLVAREIATFWAN
ncbi:MAG: alpha/beta hydrolase [Jaaginema sp. PMC 1079.18]|nr:alpha/beta hydrolase [Jaaginema sp. PMC 1080.18]MEC4852071.1 alpha/beta hydrolase [Jaaginema sp. PMC 1079.18]MEC4867251.1 alpha/beta hydrolase [Jaaginema sp. PMC 1078.18]